MLSIKGRRIGRLPRPDGLPEKVKVANYALPSYELDRARADSVKHIGAKEAEVGLEARTRSS